MTGKMKQIFTHRLEDGRYRSGPMASPAGHPYGCFRVMGPSGRFLRIICACATDREAAGWEHVSVSIDTNNKTIKTHPPNWNEMNFVKDLFWEDDETVLQFHPLKTEYVNIHPGVLHLWRQVGVNHPLPPQICV